MPCPGLPTSFRPTALLRLLLVGLILSAPIAVATADDKPDADPYAIPEGDNPTALALYLRGLMRMFPEDRTEEGLRQHFGKLSEIATEVLSRDIDEDTALMAVRIKFGSLTILSQQLGDKDAAAELAKFTTKLKQDDRPAVAKEGERLDLILRLNRIDQLTDAEQQKLVDDVAARLQEGELDDEKLTLATQTARGLEDVDRELAASAYRLFAKYMSARGDDRLAEEVVRFEGAARRLSLPGNTMQVAGTTLEGESFELESLKGKVVLVDFWATWCPPCIAELPHLKKLYEQYHDRGFEIVGITLDENRERLDQFLAQQELPWTTLFEPDADKQGWANPNVVRYGVSAIPTAILVDQEGKVVSLRAYGEELDQKLTELLGPPPADAAATTSSTTSP
ncbi:Thiol-disulfide oxidoreductase ResA [Maioricimonas rarisocia]|uniref:Thiol-disulfide oxidoreductase ResA n=1 Tax=Maioricimonas rarisocia TaxID=2528026 RepID=A0A517Z0I6_9PLAN|nr:TlpA disulfide reductase family protein [Maioricimonas rarisocia]QDU35919.1 Thiol-disulfide oxidoreductase ResA [Maioricimonas rarisocia]